MNWELFNGISTAEITASHTAQDRLWTPHMIPPAEAQQPPISTARLLRVKITHLKIQSEEVWGFWPRLQWSLPKAWGGKSQRNGKFKSWGVSHVTLTPHHSPKPPAVVRETLNSPVWGQKSQIVFLHAQPFQQPSASCWTVWRFSMWISTSTTQIIPTWTPTLLEMEMVQTHWANAKSMCKYTDWCMTAREKEIALKSTLKMYILVFILCQKWVRNWEVTDRSAFVLPYTGQGFSCSEVTVTALWAVQGRLTDCSAEAHLQKFHGK